MLPLASAFTYRVPDAMRERLFVGCRVEVPFGKRVLSGIVLEFAEQKGVAIDCGCRAWSCGSCVTAVRSGEVEYLTEPGDPPVSAVVDLLRRA